MSAADAPPVLSADLLARVLDRLGLPRSIPPDRSGLVAVYGAWSASVPFDNVRKLIALRRGNAAALPGGRADDFFSAWLAHGTGGTCWPSSNALCELLHALGFHAQRITGAMRDLGVVNHASVRVRLDGSEWLTDTSWLTGRPLPLGAALHVSDDPVRPIEVEAVDGAHVVWAHTPPNGTHLPCRLQPDPVDRDFYLRAYEASRARSPFNRRLYARRNHPGELRLLVGRTRFSRTAAGLEQRDLSREELLVALREDVGISPEMIEDWVRSGALEASFEEPDEPRPPAPVGRPPSQRGGWRRPEGEPVRPHR